MGGGIVSDKTKNKFNFADTNGLNLKYPSIRFVVLNWVHNITILVTNN